jgi:PAS domain S-box-containing protein
MAELMDFSPEQTTVPGLQWWESIVPEDRTLMTSALAASNENDAPFDLEFRIALKDGRERWLYSRGAVSRDASGKALRVHGASIDVTERKRTEEKLRESEERLRRAIEIETVGVIFFKTDGSITEANDAFLRMSGYNREDLVEGLVRWDEMTPPEWMPHSLKAIEEFKLTGRTIPYEKEYVRKDGSRWCALFAATRLDEEEGVEFIIDITERKRAEEALQEANERITNILESITDAFVAVDRQWRFTYLNERALTTLQRTREELLGKNMWEAFPEAVELPAYREYHRAMTSGTPVHFEEFNPWQGIWVEINAYPSEGGLAIYFRDITERKRAQEAFAELLRARTEFMTNVSHELRTPLTVIRGNAEVGLELGRECVHEEILEEIVRESGSMSRMVEDLLFLARSDSDSLPLDKQMVPVAWLLNKLARRAEALVSRRDTSLRTKLSGEGRLGCDAQSIEQAVLVLVDNAANYGTPGGSITLSSSTRQGELLIEVADRGPGIPPEELPQIFERFYRGESSSEERGSGLGLAIAKTIAEAHGGSVEAESRLGEGTRMFLRLPLANGA